MQARKGAEAVVGEVDTLIGHRIGGYVLLERIGQGGFGEVYRARHEDIQREVAIKVLQRRYSHDPEAVARFMSEARAVNRIAHPGIVEVFDFGQLEDGRHYAVMELIAGASLKAVLAARERLPLDEAIPILRAIAEAVDAAHAAGVAHRDLKPDNVFVLEGTPVRIKLIDFGLAKLTDAEAMSVTETGTVFGTPLYMSPEQCRGRGVDTRSDLYSFGALAYHVLAGAPPFEGEALDLALHHLNDPPAPPSRRVPGLSSHVDRAVLALLAKDPAARPSPLEHAVDALAGAMLLPAVRPARRRPITLAAGAIVLALGGVIVYAATRSEQPPAYQRRALRIDTIGHDLRVTRDGRAVVYRDRAGWWRHDLAISLVSPAIAGQAHDFRELSDGRIVVARDQREVAIEDPRDGSRRTLTTTAQVKHLSIDPSERWLVVNDAGSLVRIDLVSGRSHKLVDAPGNWASPSWSADGAHIVWTHNQYGTRSLDRLYVTRLADGATEKLAVPVAARRNSALPAAGAFLPDGRIVYCADDAGRISLRAHDRSSHDEEILAQLDPAISSCEIATHEHRIVVLATRDRAALGVLDTSAKQPVAVGVARERILSVLSPDGEIAYVQENDRLAEVNLRDGSSKPAPSCGDLIRDPSIGHHGGFGMVRRGDRLVFWDVRFEGNAQVLRFRDPRSCAVEGEWRRTTRVHDASLGAPACSPARCLIGGHDDGGMVVFELAARGELRELASTRTRTHMQPEIAISPDGRAIVTGGHTLFQLDGNRLVQIPFEGSLMSVAWTRDPARFLIATQDTLGLGLSWISLDGKRELVWGSPDTFIHNLRTTGRDDRVVMTVRQARQELLVFER